MKLNKAQMHKRPTYETLVKDTILEPKDKIALPDRMATILRKTQQLTRYDDAAVWGRVLSVHLARVLTYSLLKDFSP